MQADALDLEASVQETLERSAGADAQLSDIKALLGRMMFTGKSVHKKVSFPDSSGHMGGPNPTCTCISTCDAPMLPPLLSQRMSCCSAEHSVPGLPDNCHTM